MTYRVTGDYVPIERVGVATYTVPTDSHESDGTLEWDSTTLVVAIVRAGGRDGIGYTYADAATAHLISSTLAKEIEGRDVMDIPARWQDMMHRIRNLGRPGIAAMAISAVDAALWDVKCRLFGVSLVTLLGAARRAIPVYGSGGFTSYSSHQMADQLVGWLDLGIRAMKIKVGRNPESDPGRVVIARNAVGSNVDLMVDANGAYSRKQALAIADHFVEHGVSWFEEPVVADDVEGLRLLRDHAPVGMEVAAGEYAYQPSDFLRLLEHGAVDVLQADATRCGGITGFLNAAALSEAFHVPLSAHCAPTLHALLGCCVRPVRHVEYFQDHVRIEQIFFDGVPEIVQGEFRPDLSRTGLGISLKVRDVERFAA